MRRDPRTRTNHDSKSSGLVMNSKLRILKRQCRSEVLKGRFLIITIKYEDEMIKANQNKVYFLKKLKVLTQVIFHRNTTCLNRTNVRQKLGSKLKYRGMNSGLELVKNFCKVLTCIDGQRVILKLFLVNRLGCNLVYNSHNPDRFIITRVKF